MALLWLIFSLQHLNEAVIGALKEALHLPVQAQLREMAEKNLIPAFSQATQCMTSQINAALQAGYRECGYRVGVYRCGVDTVMGCLHVALGSVHVT